MSAVITNSHHAIRERLGKAVKKARADFSVERYAKIPITTRKLIETTSSTPARKKERLLRELERLTAMTFGVAPAKLSGSEKSFRALKERITLLRGIALKLQHINEYLEQSFMRQPAIKALKLSANRRRARPALGRESLRQLEVNAHHFMERVLELDRKAIAGYQKKETQVVRDTKTAQNEYGRILERQSALLQHLEAKLPPKTKLTKKALTRTAFTEWSGRVLSLTASLLEEHRREQDILARLAKKKAVKRELDKKISSLAKEYSKVLKIEHAKYISLRSKGGSRIREAALDVALASQL